ncbi:MAG: outer membrane beta-barrel domain-containing protein, partial [Myxococcales bacterium]|nr:outer membrane beta-barrel domain-containing protein [Myxococcales bacterium]
SLIYHITEQYHIGGTFEWFDFGEFGGTTNTFDEVIRDTSTIPEIAPIDFYAGLDFGWVPIHGKFSFFDAAIAYYDFYLTIGGGALSSLSEIHPAGSISLGQRTFMTDWLALLIEVRDRMYVEPLPSGDTFTNVLTVSVGFGFFLPPSFEYSAQEERVLDWD